MGEAAVLDQHSCLRRLLQISTLLCCASTSVHATTCAEFSRLGPTATTSKKVLDEPASEQQVIVFRKVIADHEANVSLNRLSARSKALALVRKNDQLVMFVRESLAMTRVFCFDKPSAQMRDVATEQFDYLLDAVAKRM